jgi:hypothetical protein
MKWPPASLTDLQARNTLFVVPEIDYICQLALGDSGFEQFKTQRKMARKFGGELLLIGWPDGTTITYHMHDSGDGFDVETLVETYRASAAMHRITKLNTAK